MTGLVVKKNADLFTVISEGRTQILKPRGNLRRDGIMVGDYVEFDRAIFKVCPRKNYIIRPPLANVDKMFIVLACLPEPDFLLVDKLILCCFVKGIEPVIVVNKEDAADSEFLDFVKKTYKNVAKIVITSAKNGKVASLKRLLHGVCAFAGQSAVGKSSLINALLGRQENAVGDLSKIARGRQTTRLVTLFPLGGGFIADTAGFSSLQVDMLVSLKRAEVARYYPDFLPFLPKCKYRTCNHRGSDCGVLEGVEKGKIAQMRYQNYLKIIDSLQK